MKLLHMWRRMPPLVYQQAELLQQDILEAIDLDGLLPTPHAKRECFLFSLWSVHIALMHLPPGPSRAILLWWHEHNIRRVAKTTNPGLFDEYARRQIDALYVVTNIDVVKSDAGWCVPVSERLARLFTKKLTTTPHKASEELVQMVLATLKKHSAASVSAILDD